MGEILGLTSSSFISLASDMATYPLLESKIAQAAYTGSMYENQGTVSCISRLLRMA